MKIVTSPTSTGNPGNVGHPSATRIQLDRRPLCSLGTQPRDLQFRGPLLEMFADRAEGTVLPSRPRTPLGGIRSGTLGEGVGAHLRLAPDGGLIHTAYNSVAHHESPIDHHAGHFMTKRRINNR
jgi:hypothetical protein